MYKRILVPLDGSPAAETVLPFARLLARTLQTTVEFLCVVDVTATAAQVSRGNARYFDSLIEQGIRKSDEYLKRIASTFPADRVERTVEMGKAEDSILARSAAVAGTFIVMATHGRSGMDRFLLGSVAEKVLRAATTPVLMVRAREGMNSEGEAQLNSIIVPLDGSELAETAVPAAAILAGALNLEIILLRAYETPADIYEGSEVFHPQRHAEITAEFRDEARAYLEKKADELKQTGCKKVSIVAPEGLAADEIIEHARNVPGAVIAMATHGRSGVRRWALGSVTETVVRHSDSPVWVVKAQS
jgi:nucleotide-binding universal stress UspA family protein